MSRVLLPVDRNGFPIHAFHPKSTVKIDYTVAQGRNTDPIVAQVVRLYSTTACFIKFGSAEVEATTDDMYLEAAKPEILHMRSDQYISAIRSGVDGSLYVTILD